MAVRLTVPVVVMVVVGVGVRSGMRSAVLGSCWRWRPAGDYVHHPVLEKPTT